MADGKVTIDSELNDKGIDRGLNNIQSKLNSTGKKLRSIGGNLTKSLTLPLVAAGTGALLTAKNFDDSMRKVKATMGKNLGSSTKEAEANFKKLRDEALKLGATTAHSASDASAAMKELAQMGYDTNQILASTGTVLDVASASGLELDFVATTLAGSMNQFGVEVDNNGVNIQRFGDVMVRAGQMSGTSFEEIAHALEYVGSAAHNSGMDIEQTAAYVGILGDQSIKGGKAGTALNAMLRDMKAKVKDGNLEFGDFNVAMYDSQGNMRDMTDIMADLEKGLEGKSQADKDAALNAVFGSQAQQAVNAILGEGTDKVREYEKELRMSKETAKIAAGEMEGGIGGALRGLASATEALSIAFGDVLAPVIAKIAQVIAKLFLKFVDLSDGMKTAIVAVAAILAAIGPLLSIIGTLVITISAAIGAIGAISAPVLIAAAAIAALVAIGVALYQNWDTVKAKATEVFSNFAPLLETTKTAFQNLGNSVTPIMENLKTLWQSLLPILEKLAIVVGSVLAAAFGIAISIFNATISALGPLINAVISLADFFVNAINLIIAVLTGDFAGALDYWGAMTESTINFFKSLWEGVVNFFSTFINTIIDFFYGLYMTLVGNSIIPDMVNAIVEWFSNMWQWLVDIVTGIVDAVTNAFMSVFEAIQNYLQLALDIVKSILNFIRDTFNNVLNFLVGLVTGDFGKMKDAIQNQMQSAQNLLKRIWSAIDKFLTSILGNIWTNIKSRFSAIFDTIKSITSNIQQAISNGFNAARNVISTVISTIQNVISSGFNAARNVISTVISVIQSVISSGFSAAGSIVSSITGSIRSTISSVFNALGGIVSGAMSGVSDAVWNGMVSALNAITGMISNFYNAGKNIVTSIANGITNTIGKVTDAIGSVASKVRNFLPFSPAKEGPLMDIHRLNFGGPIEDSIENAIPDVQAKMNAMLEMPTMAPPETKEAFNMSKLIKGLEDNGQTVQIRNVMVVDGEELADILVDPIDTRMTNDFSVESILKGER